MLDVYPTKADFVNTAHEGGKKSIIWSEGFIARLQAGFKAQQCFTKTSTCSDASKWE